MSDNQIDSRNETSRLKIQSNLPLRAVGIETQRERKNFTHLPPQNYLHVWWARRPTPASRLGVLASLLPTTVNDDTLLRWMQIDPSNISEGVDIATHVRKKHQTEDEREGFVYEHYGYRKIWTQSPDENELEELHSIIANHWGGQLPTVLDATAGGGAIPFESIRYGFPTIANELNPVASVILKAVLELPRVDGDLSDDIRKWGEKINQEARNELDQFFPSKSQERDLAYLWAHTIICPDCGIQLPLSPNWWLDKQSGTKGTAARPVVNGNDVDFSIIELPNDAKKSEFNPSSGTVSRGKATCIGCSVTIGGDEIKRQAQNGEMGHQLYSVYFESKEKGSEREFRAPRKVDMEGPMAAKNVIDNNIQMSTFLSTAIPEGGKTDEPRRYGIFEWRDLYSPRQLLTHFTYLRAFDRIKEEIKLQYPEEEADTILTFLAIVADKAVDYNCKLSSWDSTVPKIRNSFDRHDFAFKWSFAENQLLAEGLGYEWVLDNTLKAYSDLNDLIGSSEAETKVFQQDAASLELPDNSVQAVVLDPPYYDNVMYAELSDFFYVWLKQYLNDIYPDFFHTELTPKGEEAVANPAKFDGIASGNQSKNELAKKDYEQKMTDIFDEMHRVLDDNGIFTLMFTHKKTEAWDTLTKALIESGFIVTATHPISTENQLSLHQAGKNAAQSTILLASEKRLVKDEAPTLWSEIRQKTRKVAREKARELDKQEVDFAKVDIILASFGPTLEVFTRNYPVIDDEGNEVRPQTALDEARTAVRDYLIDHYLNEGVRDVDPITEWYTLAWLVFEAQRFPYDEANRLGKGVGVEVDDIKRSHRLWRKKSNDIVLRSHDERVQTPEDKEKSRSTKPIDPDAITFDTDLDKVHAVMYVYNTLGAIEAEKYIKDRGLETDPGFRATFEALIQVISPTHDDWELLRDIAATDLAKLIDLDLDSDVFQRAETDGPEQGKLSSFD